MEEKQTMTNKELESQLQSLQTKDLIFKILTYGCCVGLVISLVMGQLAIFFVLMIITMVFGTQWSKASGAIKKLLSDNIISGVLKEALGDAVEYNPWGKIKPGSMVFPFSYNCANGSDHIKAVYNGLNIELGDIELIYETEDTDENGRTETTRITHFKGQWLICDFGKELAGEVYISEWTNKDRRIMKSNVTMDNEQFSKRFCVRADDPQEAYYILTPHMMEYITTMADKSGGIIYLSFLRDGKMHVAVKTGRDFFEFGKSNANVGELRQKFLDELRWFTDIVDTLRVEDTLYKKEATV
ncbi:MAG: DUF3137 domain-containing protein [Butyricicoccus sp.]